MKIYELYERLAELGYEVIEMHTKAIKASIFQEGYVFIDPSKFGSEAELKCALAHELGHAISGAFYNVYSLYDDRAKCERKANRRAVEILMPVDDVRRALHRGIVQPWALAEHFDVTQQFAEMALDIYADEITRQHKRVVGLQPMIRASDLPPRPHKPAVMRDMATLKRLCILTDIKHDPLLNLPNYYF